MRFSIVRLLLVIPAFFIGILLADLFRPRSAAQYLFSEAFGRCRWIESRIAYIEEDLNAPNLSEDVINEWLAGNVATLHPDAENLNDFPGRDPWGNSYKCVRNVKVSENRVHSIGIFSMGRDGISNTQGNDADDLNSWDANSNRLYIIQLLDRKRISRAIDGALLAPVVYIGLIGCAWLFRRRRPSQM